MPGYLNKIQASYGSSPADKLQRPRQGPFGQDEGDDTSFTLKFDQPLHRFSKQNQPTLEQQVLLKRQMQELTLEKPPLVSQTSDEGLQSFSIFENSPSPMKSSGSKPASHLLKLRQQSSHGSMTYQKNLTPIDETKYEEQQQPGVQKHLLFERVADDGYSSESSGRHSYKRGHSSDEDDV